MILPLAQSAPETLLAVVIFTAISLPLGVAIGYFWAYRYKRQYLRPATELANLHGQSFRGNVSTLGIPQGVASSASPPDAAAQELQRLRQQLVELTDERDSLVVVLEKSRQQVDRLQQQAERVLAERETETADTVPAEAVGGPTGTEAWQLAQLHREQIAMQLRLDELLVQVAQLTRERDAYAARVAELEGSTSA